MQTFFTALNFRHPTEAGGGQSMGLASGGGDTGDGRVFLSPKSGSALNHPCRYLFSPDSPWYYS